MAEGLRPNQGSNGVNGGYTPPNYLQYRTPAGPNGALRPAISPPALTGTGFTPGFGGYNPAFSAAPTAAQQLNSQASPFLSGGIPGAAPQASNQMNMQQMLGQLAAGQ